MKVFVAWVAGVVMAASAWGFTPAVGYYAAADPHSQEAAMAVHLREDGTVVWHGHHLRLQGHTTSFRVFTPSGRQWIDWFWTGPHTVTGHFLYHAPGFRQEYAFTLHWKHH